MTVQQIAYMIGGRMTAGKRLLICENCLLKGAAGDVSARGDTPQQLGRVLAESLGRVYLELFETVTETPAPALQGAQKTL